MSTGVINDALQDNLSFLEEYSNSILNEIAELHINDSELITNSFDQLSNQDEIVDQLSIVQGKFTDIFQLVSTLKKAASTTKRSANVDLNNKTVKLDDVIEILKPFANGSIYKKIQSQVTISGGASDSLALKEIQLFGKLENLIGVYALLSLYQITLTQFLNNTVPLNDDIFYWDITSSSSWRTALYSIQTLPYRTTQLAENILKDFKETATPNISSLEIQVPQYIVQNYPSYINTYKLFIHYRNVLTHSLYNNILANNIKGFYKSLSKNKKFSALDFKKSPPSIKNYFSIIIGTPFVSISQEIHNKKLKLTNLQSSNAKNLGFLIANVPDTEKLVQNEGSINESIESLNSIFPETTQSVNLKSGDSLSNLYQMAQSILPKSKKSIQSIRYQNSKPAFVTRYWPTILFTGLYGPTAVVTVISNKDQIIEFIKTNLVETVRGFWVNWILKPVTNILSTIRHDDNSEISIMSQKSLDSDLDSLKRMVIEYTLENSPEYKNLKSTDMEIIKIELEKLVSSGDLTPLMKDYENDIKEPVKNLIRGKLARALLIQVQKTKVDGAVAISGIDKLLKSQELVFGIVAASPSILIVAYLFKALNSYIQKGYISRGSGERKLIVSRSLNNIERLLTEADSPSESSDINYIIGMLLLEIISLRNAGLFIIPKNRRFEWVRDVNDLNDKKLRPKAKLATVQRIHNIYGQFINA